MCLFAKKDLLIKKDRILCLFYSTHKKEYLEKGYGEIKSQELTSTDSLKWDKEVFLLLLFLISAFIQSYQTV